MAKIDQRRKAASKENTKIRLLAVERMLSRDRRITTKEIQSRLDLQYDIKVQRKTIYGDLYAINRFIPLDVTGGKRGGYKIMDFEEV